MQTGLHKFDRPAENEYRTTGQSQHSLCLYCGDESRYQIFHAQQQTLHSKGQKKKLFPPSETNIPRSTNTDSIPNESYLTTKLNNPSTIKYTMYCLAKLMKKKMKFKFFSTFKVINSSIVILIRFDVVMETSLVYGLLYKGSSNLQNKY